MEPESFVTSSAESSSTLQLRDEPSLQRLIAGFESTRVLVELCAHLAKEQETLSLSIAESVSLQYLENNLFESPAELPFIDNILLRSTMYCLVAKDSSILIDAVQQLLASAHDDQVKAARLSLAIDRSLHVLRHKIAEILIASYSHSVEPDILRQTSDTIISTLQPAIDLVNGIMSNQSEPSPSCVGDKLGIEQTAKCPSLRSAVSDYLASTFLLRHIDHSAIIVTLFFMTGYSIWSIRAGFFSASLGFLLTILLRSPIQAKITPEY
ncbi:MAG: hypothetical protein ACK5N0_04090 [Synechococcaceae cyanobacterium]